MLADFEVQFASMRCYTFNTLNSSYLYRSDYANSSILHVVCVVIFLHIFVVYSWFSVDTFNNVCGSHAGVFVEQLGQITAKLISERRYVLRLLLLKLQYHTGEKFNGKKSQGENAIHISHRRWDYTIQSIHAYPHSLLPWNFSLSCEPSLKPGCMNYIDNIFVLSSNQ